MRIVVTKHGTKILTELHETSPRDMNQRNPILSSKNYESSKASKNQSMSQASDEDNFNNLNKEANNYKSIGLLKSRFHVSTEMADKYMDNSIKDPNPYEMESPPDLLSNVLLSISKSYDSSSKLPVIKDSYPIKYILPKTSLKKLEKEIESQEWKIKTQKLTENTFRSQVLENPKNNFEKVAKKEIKTKNRNWIEYLAIDDTISRPFIEKLYKYNDNRLQTWNKICQKAIHNKSQEGLIKSIIQKKIKGEYMNENDFCKESLSSMKQDLTKYNKIVKLEYPQIDKRERYTYQYREAERNWTKYGIERYYKKNAPPMNKINI